MPSPSTWSTKPVAARPPGGPHATLDATQGRSHRLKRFFDVRPEAGQLPTAALWTTIHDTTRRCVNESKLPARLRAGHDSRPLADGPWRPCPGGEERSLPGPDLQLLPNRQ